MQFEERFPAPPTLGVNPIWSRAHFGWKPISLLLQVGVILGIDPASAPSLKGGLSSFRSYSWCKPRQTNFAVRLRSTDVELPISGLKILFEVAYNPCARKLAHSQLIKHSGRETNSRHTTKSVWQTPPWWNDAIFRFQIRCMLLKMQFRQVSLHFGKLFYAVIVSNYVSPECFLIAVHFFIVYTRRFAYVQWNIVAQLYGLTFSKRVHPQPSRSG